MTDITARPDGELIQRMKDKQEDLARLLSSQADDARFLLERGDYSGAATACHRAHQARLRMDLLRELLS